MILLFRFSSLTIPRLSLAPYWIPRFGHSALRRGIHEYRQKYPQNTFPFVASHWTPHRGGG